MGVAGDREQAKGVKGAAGEWLKFLGHRFPSFAKQRVQVLPGSPVMNGKDPGEVVGAGSADFDQWQRLLQHPLTGWKLKRVSCMHPSNPRGHIHADGLSQSHADKFITHHQLMAEPDDFDPAVPIDQVTDANHRVGVIDEPCFRAGLFHIPDDLEDGSCVAGGMGKTARTSIFSIRLPHAMLERYLEIGFPQCFARTDLNGIDYKRGSIQGILMMRVSGNGESRLPFFIQPLCQTPDNFERAGIPIHERKR